MQRLDDEEIDNSIHVWESVIAFLMNPHGNGMSRREATTYLANTYPDLYLAQLKAHDRPIDKGWTQHNE